MLQREKLQQAKEIVKTMQVDLWITLVRETEQTPDPIMPLITTVDYTWVSALMVTNTGQSIALVGNHDEEGTRQTGVWDQVHGYTESFAEVFVPLLKELNPRSIALNYSTELPAADGLTHGLYTFFTDLLQSIGYEGEICSAAEIVRRLRGQKTPTEISAVQTAINTAEDIFESAAEYIQAGLSEQEIYDFFVSQLLERRVLPAWLPSQCPGVMAGPQSVQGHNAPTNLLVSPGDVITIDFGVEQHEYCSDLQRVYYIAPHTEETTDTVAMPDELLLAFNTVRDAVQKAAEFMKPGVTGVEVDTVAREYVRSQGFPEWSYALGHEVGRKAHDGGVVLAPRWDRYKGVIDLPLLAGNVLTLELGVATSRGYVGLEEMVLITDQGAQFLSQPQQAPYIVGGPS